MKSLRLIFLFFTPFLLPVWGASINVSTLCNPTAPSFATASPGSSSCNSFSGINGASAEASASFSLSPDSFTFSLSTSAISNTVASGNASADASITDFLATAGAPRQGFVSIVCPFFQCTTYDGGAASGGFTFSIGPVSGGSCGPTNCATPPLQPIELGETYQFTADANSLAYSGGLASGQGEGEGAAKVTYTVEFFEANGITPVGVSETPEPRTWALVAIGVAWLLRRGITARDRYFR